MSKPKPSATSKPRKKRTQQPKLRLNVTDAKESVDTRINHADRVAACKPTSVVCQQNPTADDACSKVVAAGQKLKASRAAKIDADAKAAAAARDLLDDTAAYDVVHGVCAVTLAACCKTEQDVAGTGYSILTPNTRAPAAPPLRVEVKYLRGDALIHIHAFLPKGTSRGCTVEISPNKDDPTKWVRLDGDGIERYLADYAKGTWWIRVATNGPDQLSDWSDPVAVTVL